MTRRLLALVLFLCTSTHFVAQPVCGQAAGGRAAGGRGGELAPPARPVTFEEVLEGSVRFGGSIPRARFDAEGERVQVGEAWQRVDSGEPCGAPARDDDEGNAALREAAAAALPEGRNLREAWRGRQTSEDGAEVLLAFPDGFLHAREGSAANWIPLTAGARELVTLSPAGGRASFVEDGNLFVIDLPGGEPRPITLGGNENLLHGKLDWVYQEEVYGRGDFRAHWWSPDGARIAFLRLDESKVPHHRIVDHEPARQEVETMRYPKAGDPNPGVSVGIWSAATGGTTWVDLSAHGAPDEILVVRVGWSPDGSRLILQVQDRIQTSLELLAVDPGTGSAETLVREESETWVNVLGEPRWLADGSFLWLTERSGFRHIVRVVGQSPVDGAEVRERGARSSFPLFSVPSLTAGDWEVERILRIDEARREVWFSASIPSAVESHAYRVSFDGGVLTQLTRDAGSHGITIAEDGDHFLDRFSSHRDPGELRLCDREGRILRVLAEGEGPPAERLFSRPELLSVPARDGRLLDAMVWKPVPFDENREHPVWLATYSGPDAPSVRDAWDGDSWKQFLCQQGIVVLEVNNRSSSGRGQADTQVCYQRLGESELRDLEDAVAWLTAHPWADGSRVGITGWSYGGTMTAYALTHSKSFALGIAGAGVYDWRLYDTIYTERYMSTPERNPDGYKAASVIEAAADLHGHLLIVHGADDDNVHVQNAMQLALALQRAGKDFEMMVYPTAMHGIRDGRQRRHLRELEWRTIREVLLDRESR